MEQNESTPDPGHAAFMESLTPAESMLLHGAAICRFLSEPLAAMIEGKEHPWGVYRASGSVLTMDGTPADVELVAVRIPIFALQEFAGAYARARTSPDGEALSAKIDAFRAPQG